MNNKPIAVIDSGVGGLASLGEIRKAMPNEDILFFGDTAFMPFGTKTESELKDRAALIAKHLEKEDVKMIIIACNTLSTLAISSINDACPMLIVQGMVEPVIRSTMKQISEKEKLGIIATPRAIETGVYQEKLSSSRKQPEVYPKAIPELSVFVENGITEGPQLESLLHSYLDELVYEKGITSLILGCTHYPLVRDCLNKIYPDLKLIDPANELAKLSKMMLDIHEFGNEEDHVGMLKLTASKKTEGFSSMAKRLGLLENEIEEVFL